ncbi:DUF4376 domain-containing protein [Pseudomonas frederiksbergensis]|uniref:DUF4376 domain-containing protein n=1 Tax=Pseudomonas frederiksbergensis TaxID=104087 RepID=UPI000F4999FC|nr:DUF4376 domain-containing protein [Pseudomonas frederiksbergensis]
MYPPSLVWVCVDKVYPMPLVSWKAAQVDGEWEFLPVKTIVAAPEERAQKIAAERFIREASGVFVDEMNIETARDSQALIASTGLSAILDPAYRCNFKTLDGFFEIGSKQIIAIAKAVRAHVQACFDRELHLLRALEAGTYTDEMLAEGWPDSTLPTPITAPQ